MRYVRMVCKGSRKALEGEVRGGTQTARKSTQEHACAYWKSISTAGSIGDARSGGGGGGGGGARVELAGAVGVDLVEDLAQLLLVGNVHAKHLLL